jgi:hypothetical protein
MRSVYLVQLLDDSYIKVVSNFKPQSPDYKTVVKVPNNLKNESERWLQIENVDDGFGNLVPTVTINQTEKDIQTQLDAEKELTEANAKAKEQKIQKEIKRFQFALRVKAEIAVINNEKNWSRPQTKAYLNNPKIKELGNILNSGALNTAKEAIFVSDLSEFYTGQEKQYILDLIQDYLDNE